MLKRKSHSLSSVKRNFRRQFELFVGGDNNADSNNPDNNNSDFNIDSNNIEK